MEIVSEKEKELNARNLTRNQEDTDCPDVNCVSTNQHLWSRDHESGLISCRVEHSFKK